MTAQPSKPVTSSAKPNTNTQSPPADQPKRCGTCKFHGLNFHPDLKEGFAKTGGTPARIPCVVNPVSVTKDRFGCLSAAYPEVETSTLACAKYEQHVGE